MELAIDQQFPIKSLVKKINNLHKGIFGAFKTSFEKAIEIGGLLIECKEKIPHGEWLHWMNVNLKFSQKTASNYMRIYKTRENPKLVSLTNLWKAEQSLIEHKPKPKQGVIEGEIVESEEEENNEEEKKDEKPIPIETDEINEMLGRGEDTNTMTKVMYFWESCTLQEKIILFNRFKKDMKGV